MLQDAVFKSVNTAKRRRIPADCPVRSRAVGS